MLDGLEVAEIRYSRLERTKRVDSEYFLKEYLQIDKSLGKLKTELLPNLVNVSDGNHFAISEKFIEEGIPYYRGQDTSHFFIEQSSPMRIDEVTFYDKQMMRSHLKKMMFCFPIVGTIGETSLVTTNIPATCSCKLAIFRSNTNKVDPEYLAIESKYGKGQINRLILWRYSEEFFVGRYRPSFYTLIE